MQSIDEEWVDAQAAVKADSTRTRLNGNRGPSYGCPQLSIHDDEVGPLGDLAGEMGEYLVLEGEVADEGTRLAATGLGGDFFETRRALLDVADTWLGQVGNLRSACRAISSHLRYSVAAHAEDDAASAGEIKQALGNQAVHGLE